MELLRPEEVARILNVTRRTVYQYARERILPFVQLRKAIRFKRSDIEKFIEERTVDENRDVDDIVKEIAEKIR